MESVRSQYMSAVKSMVIKLGTQVLNDNLGTLDAAFLADIARQVATLRSRGVAVTIVSSGAIGAGLRELKQIRKPTDLARLQATAAVGQRKLMDQWADAFEPHKLPVAQLLLTREDIEDRNRYLNLRNTIAAVHELGAIPIVNENDTISTDELVRITFGDNDILAATVAHALCANLLVLLSVVDGVLDAHGQPIRTVSDPEQARELVRRERTTLGKGGMDSKLTAARMVTDAGEVMVVANGRMEDVLLRIVDGQEVGTIFIPTRPRLNSRSRWIGSRRPAGAVIIDDGAVRALVEKNRSLLPAGIRQVEGEFERGDVIEVKAVDGRRVAQGLSNYSAAALAQICGKKTADVRLALGEAAYDEAIHRDNLVVG